MKLFPESQALATALMHLGFALEQDKMFSNVINSRKKVVSE